MRLKATTLKSIARATRRSATVVVMDMSGSMGRSGLYVHVKRMALAMDGLIRRSIRATFAVRRDVHVREAEGLERDRPADAQAGNDFRSLFA
jgi:uncharacterized protein with von Willebrand factor type A (vWA) domain